VVHLRLTGTDDPSLVGFVVSRSVGGSVVRNRVERRLRHLVAARVDALPRGAHLVVRASPAAATATSQELGSDLDSALRAAVRLRPERSGGQGRPATSAPAVGAER